MTTLEEEQQIEILRLRTWLEEIKREAINGDILNIESMAWDALNNPATKVTCPYEYAKLGLWPHRSEYCDM